MATAKTVLETDTSITGRPAELLRDVAERNGRLQFIRVDGNGESSLSTIDLTPRDSRGRELQVAERRASAILARTSDIERSINAFTATVPGRSVLAGLQAVPDGTGPVVVFSPLLDTVDPLSIIALGFDVAPTTVVHELGQRHELPLHLRHRSVVFVVTPVVGRQGQPRQPQQIWLRQLMSAVVTSAGARSVTFLDGQADMPAAVGGTAPVVPIPPAPGSIRPTTTTAGPLGRNKSVTCVIPNQVFEPDQDTLIDPAGVRLALAGCVSSIRTAATVRIEGHTACRNAADSDRSVAYRLSRDRARRIADLLEQLHVPSRNISIRGYGDTEPLVHPCQDPANRATVVKITTTTKEHP